MTAVDDANLPTEKRSKTIQDFLVMVKLLEKDPSTKKTAAKKSDPNLLSRTVQEEKEYISESVKIDSNVKEGRFGVAARDIKIGEELIVEKPGAAVLLQEYTKTHCQHCFIRFVIQIFLNTFFLNKFNNISYKYIEQPSYFTESPSH